MFDRYVRRLMHFIFGGFLACLLLPTAGLATTLKIGGIGIARQDIPKALAPFQRIEAALDRKHQGTGPGLPLAKSLIEMRGGSMHLQSENGVGTTVTVRFPVARVVVENLQDRIATGLAASS